MCCGTFGWMYTTTLQLTTLWFDQNLKVVFLCLCISLNIFYRILVVHTSIYEGPANSSVSNRLPSFYPRYILKCFTALEWCFEKLTIPVYFVQIAFQLTELFQIEIDAVIYTDQFTCYNKKRPSKGWSRIHRLHDNVSFHKCEVVKSFFGFWKGESFKPSTLFTWPESLWLLFFSKAYENAFWKQVYV